MVWIWILIATLLAALALQAGLLAFAMYVLLGVLLTSRYLSRNWVASLAATREFLSEPVEIGTKVEIKLRIRNTGTLPVAWVLAEDLLPTSATKSRPPRLRVKGKRIRLASIRVGKSITVKYKLDCQMRGYYQIGPLVLETGDLFGLHRRHRVATEPGFLMVYPKVLPLPHYDFASRRPIGEIRLAHRLFEDPTRNAGVRPYQIGDPLQRIHWRATARTGELHSRVFEPTTLAGGTLLLDFHSDGYHSRGEPYRSELAVTATASLANALTELGQQVGLVSNGRDAIDRINKNRQASMQKFETRDSARESVAMSETSDRLNPIIVETRRGIEIFQRIRETLARLELSDGLTFAHLVLESTPRLPRDATVIALLPRVPIETSTALGTLVRQGFAVTAVLIGMEDEERSIGHGRLLAESVRDVRWLNTEADLMLLGQNQYTPGEVPYGVEQSLV